MNLLEIIGIALGAVLIVSACGAIGFFGAPWVMIVFFSKPLSRRVPTDGVLIGRVAPIVGFILGLLVALAILHAMGFPHG